MGYGASLKKILTNKNMTVIDLSEKTGIPSTTLYSIIKRDSNDISTETLAKICEALGTEATYSLLNENYKATYKVYYDVIHEHMHDLLHEKSTSEYLKTKLQLFAEPSMSYNAPLDVSDLTNAEIEQVKQYIEFLKSQRNKNVHSTTD